MSRKFKAGDMAQKSNKSFVVLIEEIVDGQGGLEYYKYLILKNDKYPRAVGKKDQFDVITFDKAMEPV